MISKKDKLKDFIGFLILIIPSIIFSGYTLTKLWSWFVVGIFGIEGITIAQAIGLNLLITYFKSGKVKQEEYEPYKFTTALFSTMWINLIFLGMGAIIIQFI